MFFAYPIIITEILEVRAFVLFFYKYKFYFFLFSLTPLGEPVFFFFFWYFWYPVTRYSDEWRNYNRKTMNWNNCLQLVSFGKNCHFQTWFKFPFLFNQISGLISIKRIITRRINQNVDENIIYMYLLLVRTHHLVTNHLSVLHFIIPINCCTSDFLSFSYDSISF